MNWGKANRKNSWKCYTLFTWTIFAPNLNLLKERSVSVSRHFYEGKKRASDWPSCPRKEGWNYSVDCLANQRPFFFPHKNGGKLTQISLWDNVPRGGGGKKKQQKCPNFDLGILKTEGGGSIFSPQTPSNVRRTRWGWAGQAQLPTGFCLYFYYHLLHYIDS